MQNENGFTVHAKLPSLNDVIDKDRTCRYAGASYRREVEKLIARYIVKSLESGELRPVSTQCAVHFLWHEKNSRRNVDDIQSAQKFILDAMVRCGIIPDDSRKYVTQTAHTVIDSVEYGVDVIILPELTQQYIY